MGGADPSLGGTCHAMITAAGEELVSAARRTGEVRADVAAVDLLKLANAISLSAEATRPKPTACSPWRWTVSAPRDARAVRRAGPGPPSPMV